MAHESSESNLEAFITELSKHIGSKWKSLARHLDLLETRIDAIVCANPNELEEQIFQFFRRWKQQMGKDATVERLSAGLIAAGLQELESQVKQHIHTLPKKCDPPLNELGGELFNNQLYNICEKYCKYKPGLRTVAVYFLLMYQFGIVVLVTLCEDGGILHPPYSSDVSSDLIVRTLKLALRTLLQVITPLVFMLHINTLAKKPEVPKFKSLTREDALYYQIYIKLGETEEVVKSRITLRGWSTVVNNILFAVSIYYLGVFITTNYHVEPLTAGDSICNYLYTLLYNPWIEGTQTVVFVLVIGIIKEFYYYENAIAVYAVVIGDEGRKLYDEIRSRWSLLDLYCYCVPVVLSLVAVFSYSTEKGLIPEPRQEIEQTEIITWYFWNFVLCSLTLLGSSPNQLAKHAALISYVLLIILMHALEHNGIKIPGTGTNSAMIFLYVTLAVFIVNLIFTLYRCNKYHYDKPPNLFQERFCLVSMFVLPVLIIFMTHREVCFFVPFIKQQL